MDFTLQKSSKTCLFFLSDRWRRGGEGVLRARARFSYQKMVKWDEKMTTNNFKNEFNVKNLKWTRWRTRKKKDETRNFFFS